MPDASPIKHVIVLMLENNSFDNLYGAMPEVSELTAEDGNFADPCAPSAFVPAGSGARPGPAVEFPHDLNSVTTQIFGPECAAGQQAPRFKPMSGFIKAAAQAKFPHAVKDPVKAMEGYDIQDLPVLHALACNFLVCTRWFSSIPGPTCPNRYFASAASSDGVTDNNPVHWFDMPTIFGQLEQAGCGWNVYFHDIPVNANLVEVRSHPDRLKRYKDFARDIKNGHLAEYTFIEPRYLDTLHENANDGHPPHDIRLTEALIADVYNIIRGSHFWKESLLIVVFDEHGGHYDHVLPPRLAPGPDDERQFEFDRLGVRVPALLISPWIPQGKDDRTYEHVSILATVKKIFGLKDFLNPRTAAANTFEDRACLPGPREDTPPSLAAPAVPAVPLSEQGIVRILERVGFTGLVNTATEVLDLNEGLVALAHLLSTEWGTARPPEGVEPLTPEHDEWVNDLFARLAHHPALIGSPQPRAVAGAAGGDPAASFKMSEQDAGDLVEDLMKSFLGR